jgi:hypothetical protein
MKTMIRSLSMALMLIVSLAGGMPSAFATTIFGVQFHFTDTSGVEFGGGFLQFDVNPNNLPFDQWIDLSTVTGLKANFWATTPGHGDSTFSLADGALGAGASIFIANNNPLFPVEFRTSLGIFGDPDNVFSASYREASAPSDTFLSLVSPDGNSVAPPNFVSYADGSTSQTASGLWTAGAWFDDPIPVTSVPEPAAYWLFGAGLLVLAAKARRRQAA